MTSNQAISQDIGVDEVVQKSHKNLENRKQFLNIGPLIHLFEDWKTTDVYTY